MFSICLGVIGATSGACDSDDGAASDPGLLGEGPLNPFPSMAMVENGVLNFDAVELPMRENGKVLQVERFGAREGFSPVQYAVLTLEGIRADALPSWRTPTPGEGGVQLLDLDDGEFLPVFAELDAAEDAGPPALLIRPLVAMTPGHQVAVIVTTDVVDRPARMQTLLDGKAPTNFRLAEHYLDLFASLEEQGVDLSSVAVAWDFPIGDGADPSRQAVQFASGGEYNVDKQLEADDEEVMEGTYRYAELTLKAPSVLIDGDALDIGSDGIVASQEETDVLVVVYVPDSVRDADAGTVPIVIFGHGFLQNPRKNFLEDVEAAKSIADLGGFIALATEWRGFTARDQLTVAEVAGDLGAINRLTDRMLQSQVNIASIVDELKNGELLADDLFKGESGQLLPDVSQIRYHGVSLGCILGGVTVGLIDAFDTAAFQIGGGGWTLIVERSGFWAGFEGPVRAAFPRSHDRHVLLSTTQLFFDSIEPALFGTELSARSILLQESIGDDRVTNIATELLARVAEVPAVRPTLTEPFGLAEQGAPHEGSGLTQYDPEVEPPPDVNRPAPESDGHSQLLKWPGAQAQVVTFLRPETEGTVEHYCGDKPCAASNQGSLP